MSDTPQVRFIEGDESVAELAIEINQLNRQIAELKEFAIRLLVVHERRDQATAEAIVKSLIDKHTGL